MDPITAVGITVNVGALIQLTSGIIVGLIDYCLSVKCAPVKSKELRDELLVLSDVLKELETIIKPIPSPHMEGSQRSLSLQKALSEFGEMLNDMYKRVAISKMNFTKRIKWPFTEKENVDYLARMERYKATFTLALSSVQRYGLPICRLTPPLQS